MMRKVKYKIEERDKNDEVWNTVEEGQGYLLGWDFFNGFAFIEKGDGKVVSTPAENIQFVTPTTEPQSPLPEPLRFSWPRQITLDYLACSK